MILSILCSTDCAPAHSHGSNVIQSSSGRNRSTPETARAGVRARARSMIGASLNAAARSSSEPRTICGPPAKVYRTRVCMVQITRRRPPNSRQIVIKSLPNSRQEVESEQKPDQESGCEKRMRHLGPRNRPQAQTIPDWAPSATEYWIVRLRGWKMSSLSCYAEKMPCRERERLDDGNPVS